MVLPNFALTGLTDVSGGEQSKDNGRLGGVAEGLQYFVIYLHRKR